jgi:hypothetical protein
LDENGWHWEQHLEDVLKAFLNPAAISFAYAKTLKPKPTAKAKKTTGTKV